MRIQPMRTGLIVLAALVGGGAGRLIFGAAPFAVASAVTVAIGALAAAGFGALARSQRQPGEIVTVGGAGVLEDNGTPISARDVDGRHSQVGTTWWENPTVPAVGPGPAAPDRPTRDVFSYLPATRIPQCPHCGAFGPSTRALDGRFRFLCPQCAHQWDWSRHEPWPAVRLDPRLHS